MTVRVPGMSLSLAGAFLAWVVALSGAGAAQAAAQAPSQKPQAATTQAGIVLGRVLDPSGAVIVGASVTLQGTTAAFDRTVTTDGRGQFRFDNVPSGQFLLIGLSSGFSAHTLELTFDAKASKSVDLTLETAPFTEEVTVSYTAPASLTATKMSAPVRDIPLSVKSFTGSFITALQAARVGEVLTYMTGVSQAGNSAYDFTIRGVRSQEPGNIQVNGRPGLAARFGSPSTINVERIEVLKGPASVLYGQVQPGGVVNIITKKPEAQRSQMIDVRFASFAAPGNSFGSENTGRVAADFTGPIDRNQRVLYRAMFSYDNAESFRYKSKEENLYLAPSITFVSKGGAALIFEGEYRREQSSLDNGLVVPNNDITAVAPRTTRYQEPDDAWHETGKVVSVFYTQVLAKKYTWNTTWRSVFHDDWRRGYESNSILKDNVTLRRRDRYQVNERSYQFGDTNVKWDVMTGAVRHTLLFGFGGGYELEDADRRQFNASPTLDVNIYHPVYGLPGAPSKPGTHLRSSYWNFGGYVENQMTLSANWKALAGLRYDTQNGVVDDLRNNTSKKKDIAALLPMGGIVYQPNRVVSLYTSYSVSFVPPGLTVVDEQGQNSFDPERGRQVEGGVKIEAFNGQMDATVAVFNIVRDDVINAAAPGYSVQTGQERSRGMELEFRAKPLPSWQVIFGYSYIDAEITKDQVAGNIGAKSMNVPKNSLNLWTRYDIPDGKLKGFGFGLGVVQQSQRTGSLPSTSPLVLLLPGYARMDLGVYYVAEHYDVALKVTNATDKLYYESASNVISVTPGRPRQMTLSMRVKF